MKSTQRKLINIIEQRGPISVAEYMEYCLFDPEEGYYRTHSPIGRKGDFITAPEISQMFGEMIGLWVLNQWEQYPENEEVTLIELGPGHGTLMVDLLRTLSMRPNLLKNLQVHLLEINEHLIKRQKEQFKNHNVIWHSKLDSLLQNFPSGKLTFIIANEFFYVFPIHQYVYQEQWFERLITYDPQQELFSYCLSSQPAVIASHLQHYPPPQIGDIVEISDQMEQWFSQLLTYFSHNKGGMLIIDYGYVQPLYGDSLQAIKNHQYAKVLKDPGECDLTTHINFWKLSQQSHKSALKSHLTTQGEFLIDNGIRIRAAQLSYNKSPEVQQQINLALTRLISSQEMGQLFKVLELYSH